MAYYCYKIEKSNDVIRFLSYKIRYGKKKTPSWGRNYKTYKIKKLNKICCDD